MVSKILVVCLLGLSFSSPVFEQKKTLRDTDGPWESFGVTGYSGLVTMNGLSGSSLFYWLFEAIDGNITADNLPLIIWLQGGPGCSGSFGMLFENISPLSLTPNAQPFRTNSSYTWGTDYHIMSIDFPYGAGYSFAARSSDEKDTTQAATLYLYNFLGKLNTKYPSWFNRTLYIFGESYGGHWVPGLAYNILAQNSSFIKLGGIGIGDPWVDPYTQSQTYGSYGYSTSLINSNELAIVNYYQSQVTVNLNSGQLLQAEANWENSYDAIVSFSGGVNVYNVRTYGDYNDNYVSVWLNQASTKALLNVPSSISWISCNDTVYDYYKPDIMNSSSGFISYILSQNVPVMIYNGQDDLIVNSPGVENMISKLNWSGINNFLAANKTNWYVNGNIAGYAQTYSYFTFVLVLDSGHLAPHDQPINVKDMVRRFINGTGWN
jgi:carboxypeptidase C (cathepsin A)